MAILYAVGPSWNAIASWSLSSGGAGGAGVPTINDEVKFDANSISMQINTAASCKSINSAGFTATLTQNLTKTLTVGSGGIAWVNGTFIGGDADILLAIGINGTLNISGGSFTSTSANLRIGGNLTITGTWIHNFGTVTFVNSNNNIAVSVGASIFNNVTLVYDNQGRNFSITGIIDVNGVTTWQGKIGQVDTGIWLASGDIIITAIESLTTPNTGLLKLDGSGTQAFNASGGTGYISTAIEIASSGTVNIADTLIVSFNGVAWKYTSGNVVAGTSKISFKTSNQNLSVDSSGMSFYSIEINISPIRTFTLDSNMDVNGELIITSCGTINGNTITVAGNITTTDTSVSGTTAITWNGTTAKNLNTNAGAGRFPNGLFTINGSGTLTLSNGALVLDAVGQDLIVTAGTFDLNGYDLTVNDTFTVTDGLILKGNETITTSLTVINDTSSTVTYKDSAVVATLDQLTQSYYNLILGASKTHEITNGVSNGIAVKGDFSTNGDSGNRSLLRSDVDGNQWELDLQGTSSLVDAVDVKDSDADVGNTVYALGSINQGNNNNWVFVSEGATCMCNCTLWLDMSDNTLKDLCCFNNVVTPINLGVSNIVNGVGGSKALLLNGVDEYIRVAYSIIFDYDIDYAFTYFMWVKPSSIAADFVLMGSYDGSDGFYWWYDIAPTPRLCITVGGVTESIDYTLLADKWVCIAMTRSAEDVAPKQYINGSLLGSYSGNLSMSCGGNNIGIGADTQPASYFPGIIDYVLLFNRELRELQVKQFHKRTRQGMFL